MDTKRISELKNNPEEIHSECTLRGKKIRTMNKQLGDMDRMKGYATSNRSSRTRKRKRQKQRNKENGRQFSRIKVL